MIKRDIARTFPDHSFFKDKDGIGQGTLFNVIKVGKPVNTVMNVLLSSFTVYSLLYYVATNQSTQSYIKKI